MTIKKNAIKEWGHRACLRVSRLLKLVTFTGFRVKKNSNHLHTELILDYLKDTKCYLENKASFIHISSIASFKPFLIAWLREYCMHFFGQFRGELAQNTPIMELFCKKNHVLLSNFFPSSNLFFIRLFLANTKKKSGINVLV